MIVLDEQISRDALRQALAWYPGQVKSLKELRRGTVIKDEAVPLLLRATSQPTFLTINVSDFWLQSQPDRRFCILCFPLVIEQFREVSHLLRPVLRLPEFGTKAARMGKVALVHAERVEFYSLGDRHVREVLVPSPGRYPSSRGETLT